MNPIARDLLAVIGRLEWLCKPLDGAVDHLRHEVAHCADSVATDDPRVHTSGTSSPTERAALVRYALGCHIEDLRDSVHVFHAMVEHVESLIGQSYRLRGPVVQPASLVALCRDGLKGRDGSIAWGDPTCMFPASKAGLCGAHYFRWRRWRIAHSLPVDQDIAPVR